MKRHHQRQAQQLLTLSLMGSLALLAACGGGGKGAAPAAPAEVASAVVEDPTLQSVTDANEPYIVSPSTLTSEVASKNRFNLVILDGGKQSVKKTITLTRPLDGQWTVVNKIVTKDGIAVDKGPHTLYFIQEVRKLVDPADLTKGFRNFYGGQVYKVDLTQGSDLVAKPISGVFNACFIKSTYNLNQDGSKTALIVNTSGPDGECGNAKGSETEVKQANDNVDLIVTSDDAAGVPEVPGVAASGSAPAVATIPAVPGAPGKTAALPGAKVLQYLYDKVGVLTGILVERQIAVPGNTQMDVVSNTMDSVLSDYVDSSDTTKPAKHVSGVAITDGIKTVYTYASNPSNPDIGASWIAREPGSYSSGYMRIQDTSASPAFNRFYKFTWDPTTTPVTAKLELENTRALTPSSNPNTGLTSSKYIYFVNGQNLVYGPVDDPDLRFPTLKLGFTTDTSPITAMYETTSSIVTVQTDRTTGWQRIVATSKATGASQELASSNDTNKLTILGFSGDFLYTTHVNDGASGTQLFRRSTQVPYTDFDSSLKNVASNVIVQTKVFDPTINGQRKELRSLVLCQQPNQLINSCLGSTLKVFDIVSNKLSYELGSLLIEDADAITISSPQALTTTNNVFGVSTQLPNGSVRVDPWLYNINTSQNLKRIKP